MRSIKIKISPNPKIATTSPTNNIDNFLMCDETLGTEEPDNSSVPHFNDNEMLDVNDLFTDPSTSEKINRNIDGVDYNIQEHLSGDQNENNCNIQRVDDYLSVNDYLQEDPSGDQHGINGKHFENCNPRNPNIENPIQLPVWPLPSVPFTCSCCQVLREIIHTKGVESTKLEIHGRLGMICHGILERSSVDMSAPKKDYQMLDFCKESIYGVKQYFVQYCEERKKDGYTMQQDPLLTFYEALCVGLDWDWDWDCDFFNIDIDDLLQFSPLQCANQPEAMNQTRVLHTHQTQVLHTPVQETAERQPKRSLAEQRERTKSLTVKDFVAFFNCPIDNVAKEFDMSCTAIKNICRRDGLLRWPYRKVKSLEKQIQDRSTSLNAANVEERERARADVENLQQELDVIYSQYS